MKMSRSPVAASQPAVVHAGEDANHSREAPAGSRTRHNLEKHVAVRLDTETIARLDALIPALSTDWIKARRSDVLRRVILCGLATIEKQQRTSKRRAQPATPRRTPKPKR
ncbi:MAG: hypothetical protein QM820_04630 [Minicystis sp.]